MQRRSANARQFVAVTCLLLALAESPVLASKKKGTQTKHGDVSVNILSDLPPRQPRAHQVQQHSPARLPEVAGAPGHAEGVPDGS